MDVSQYLEIFIEESKEHLQNLNETLLEMEKDTQNRDYINEIFRVAHTLKGMAATMGFKRMSVLTHEMENVFSRIRSDDIGVTAELLDILFRCLDALEGYLDVITATGTEGEEDHKQIVDGLISVMSESKAETVTTKVDSTAEEGTEEAATVQEATDREAVLEARHLMMGFNEYEKAAILSAAEEGYSTYGITIYISDTCVLKSARAFIIFRALEGLGRLSRLILTCRTLRRRNSKMTSPCSSLRGKLKKFFRRSSEPSLKLTMY